MLKIGRNEKIIILGTVVIIGGGIAWYFLSRNKLQYPSAMTSSDNLISYLKQKEGLQLMPYWDVNNYSIGYGHQIQPDEQWMMQGITEDQANDTLASDLSACESDVVDAITVELNQNQFDALVEFRFNLGEGHFENSTLVKKINAGASQDEITAQFLVWDRNDVDAVRRQWDADTYVS